MDVEKIRQDFPILSRKFSGKPLAYLDNAATTQKPLQVLGAMEDYYTISNANVNRGAYQLGAVATEEYARARKKVAAFIGARPEEVIFTRNATESLNLAAAVSCEEAPAGGKILLTQMEHHSNIVPWQLAAKRNGLKVEYASIRSHGALCMEDVEERLAASPFIFSFTHVSNVLGTINDAKRLSAKAKEAGALVCIDAAQSVQHMEIDVNELGCDFLAFSAHKMMGPMGTGVLFMKKGLQEKMPPFLSGGDMIRSVSFNSSTWNSPPYKYEAGTPNVAGAVGLAAAIDYLLRIGLGNAHSHSVRLAKACREELAGIPSVRFHGPARGAGIVSFNVGKIHAHDLATFADSEGIAIRAGHHCCQPLMGVLGEVATARASFFIYNTEEEAGRLAFAVKKAKRAFG